VFLEPLLFEPFQAKRESDLFHLRQFTLEMVERILEDPAVARVARGGELLENAGAGKKKTLPLLAELGLQWAQTSGAISFCGLGVFYLRFNGFAFPTSCHVFTAIAP